MKKSDVSQANVVLATHFLSKVFPDYDWSHPTPDMKDTAARFFAQLVELTSPESVEFTVFPNEAEFDEMVTVGPIDFTSVCAHHIIPFIGRAWVSYIPGQNLCGLSKLARVVKETAKGLWMQEELTQNIANNLQGKLKPFGLGVVLKAEHMCMTVRGVQSPGTQTTTSSMKGVYLDPNKQARQEFLSFIKD